MTWKETNFIGRQFALVCRHMPLWHWIFTLILLNVSSGDVKPKQEKYYPDYKYYHNISQVQSEIAAIATRYSQYIKLDSSYVSRENSPQMLVRLTNFTQNKNSRSKTRILLSFGEHAREFIPVESMLYLLHNITQGLKTRHVNSFAYEFSRHLLTNVDLYIVGVMNPDGRRYVEKTNNYCWRGTSTGVDINRNFDWNFAESGSSKDKEDEEYRGPYAFSEPESLVLKEVTAKYKFDAFISLHSGIRQIYIPFADTSSKKTHRKPANSVDMEDLAHQMSHSTIHKFKYGQAYVLNEYTADGTVFDFMAGVRKIPFSYAVELWGVGDIPGLQCFDLFNPPSNNLQKSLDEIHPLYVTLFTYLINWKKKHHLRVSNNSLLSQDINPTHSIGITVLCCLVILTLGFVLGIHRRLHNCSRFYPRRRIISLRSLSSAFSIST